MMEKKCPILRHSTTINAIFQGFNVLSSGHEETNHICFCHLIGVALVFIGMTTVLVGCDTAFFFLQHRMRLADVGEMKELFDPTLVEES